MKLTKQTAYFVDHNDFEQFVDDKFGVEHPYECADELASSNYVSHEFEIDGNISEQDVQDIAERRSGNNRPLHPRQILDMLCYLNKI